MDERDLVTNEKLELILKALGELQKREAQV